MKRLISLLLALTLTVMLLPARPARAGLLAEAVEKQKGCRLEFQDDARGEWKKLNGDKIQVRFQVTNPSAKTVKGFELYVYATDIWGERIYGEGTYYYWTTTKKIAPAKPPIPIGLPCRIAARLTSCIAPSSAWSIRTAISRKQRIPSWCIGTGMWSGNAPGKMEGKRNFTRTLDRRGMGHYNNAQSVPEVCARALFLPTFS